MANLIPVDHDPFDLAGALAASAKGPDPLIAPPRNPAMPADWAQNAVRGAAGKMADIVMAPRRAMDQGMTTAESTDWAAETAMALAGAGAPAAARGALGSAGGKLVQPQGIRAYHGSPHDFERFDISKIGTGEGAQSYGHGLYFAENQATAQSYRDTLSGARATPSPSYDDLWGTLNSLLLENGHNPHRVKSVLTTLKGEHQSGGALKYVDPNAFPEGYQEIAREALTSGAKTLDAARGVPTGRMYEVNINAKPEQFLDWDKPLAQMSDPVRRALNDAQLAHPEAHAHQTGREIYNVTARDAVRAEDRRLGFEASNPMAGGQVLRDAGIPGIKYLDQGSRTVDPEIVSALRKSVEARAAAPFSPRNNAGDLAALEADRKRLDQMLNPTSNYVLFDDKIIDILRKYGVAGLAALPPAVAAHVKSRLVPVDHDPFAQQ